MRYLLSIASVFVVTAAIACGGSTNSIRSAASSTPVSDAAFEIAAEQAAEASHLTLGDMPQGWTGKVHTSNPAIEPDLPSRCQLLNADALPNAVLSQDTDDFEGPSNESVSSGVAVYRTADLASGNMAQLADTETSCSDDVVKAFKESVFSSATFDDLISSFTEVKVPDVTSARLFRFTFSGHISGKPFAGHADVGFIVSGRIALALFDGSPSPPRIEDLLTLMSKRATAADASLPH
jgi:hypothetical protein